MLGFVSYFIVHIAFRLMASTHLLFLLNSGSIWDLRANFWDFCAVEGTLLPQSRSIG